VTILRLWRFRPFEAREHGPQFFEPASRQDLARLRRCHPEHAAEAGAEVAVVAEAGLDRQRRDVALAIGEPLERHAEAESKGIARDRLPRGRAELARQVERRAAQRATESGEIPADRRRAGEERLRPLDPEPLPRPEPAMAVAGRRQPRRSAT